MESLLYEREIEICRQEDIKNILAQLTGNEKNIRKIFLSYFILLNWKINKECKKQFKILSILPSIFDLLDCRP